MTHTLSIWSSESARSFANRGADSALRRSRIRRMRSTAVMAVPVGALAGERTPDKIGRIVQTPWECVARFQSIKKCTLTR